MLDMKISFQIFQITVIESPAYIEDCDFSPDGKFAVYVFGKHFFGTIINAMTFGQMSKSSYLLKEVNTETKREKVILEGYKFFPFYSPVYSLDGNTIYFQTDGVGRFKDKGKGLYAYNRVNGSIKYEVFVPFGNPFVMPDGNLLICYLRNIYIYDIKKKDLLHVFSLDRDCPEFIYYSRVPVK